MALILMLCFLATGQLSCSPGRLATLLLLASVRFSLLGSPTTGGL
jgi:hypothetical protein